VAREDDSTTRGRAGDGPRGSPLARGGEARARELFDRLDRVMIADARPLRRRIARWAESGGAPGDLAEIEARLARSLALREARAASRPTPSFDMDLPVCARAEEIARAIDEHQVIVLCGETGSGKTTQLPKIALSIGRGIAGMIGHTQPRRLAARSVAARIAQELGVGVGTQVGCKVRFGDQTGDQTLVKLMTDGILLAEIQSDPHLDRYDALIIDEAHERSLNIDFLLGYLRRLLPHRPDLKLIVTSATIDPERFAHHFAQRGKPAPIIEVSGRTYPVDIRYKPPQATERERTGFGRSGDRAEIIESDPDLAERALRHAIDEIVMEGPGDILIFMPGEREIRDTADLVARHMEHIGERGVEVLPLYARLASHEQDRVFKQHSGRRVVIATNVAETSLTVPGIRGVIDPGTARINRYSPRTRVQRLEIEAISQASAKQRAGRCGRVGPGVCVRLYSEEDLRGRPEHTDPEIQRTNLASVVLQMRAMRLGAIERFPFIDPPDPRRIRDGVEALEEIGAIDPNGALTKIGRDLSRLPLDPRFGRMLLAAQEEDAVREVLIIVSMLSTQDPRLRPLDKREDADAAHARFADPQSDFITIVKMWDFLEGLHEKLSSSRFKRACEENYISYVRWREWRDVHRQLRLLLAGMGYHASEKKAEYDPVHRALLAGMLTSVGRKGDQGEYAGVSGVKFSIHPGSGLFKERPKWVMAAELVRTTKLFARTVARVEPEWVERAAAHLVKRTYDDPRWDPRTGRVLASERVLLRGLELVKGRSVHYGPIEPAMCRSMFIRHALIEGDLRTKGHFLEHNRLLRESLEREEAKLRRRGAVIQEGAEEAFYDARLPRDAFSGARFERWRKDAELREPGILRMKRHDLVRAESATAEEQRFPDQLEVFGERLKIEYAHVPGEAGDGVTLTVPLRTLASVDAAAQEWLVPGLLREKIETLLRGLAKDYRRRLDVARLAQDASEKLPFAQGDLLDAMSRFVLEASQVRVPREAWSLKDLPQHLRMNYRVVDEHGQLLGEGRDLAALRQALGGVVAETVKALEVPGYPKHGIKAWEFGELETHVELGTGAPVVRAFPAIVDKVQSVSLELRSERLDAERETRAGVRRLLALQFRGRMGLRPEQLPGFAALATRFATLADPTTLKDQLLLAITERACMESRTLPRTREQFDAMIDAGWRSCGRAIDEIMTLLDRVLVERHALLLILEQPAPPAWRAAIEDVRAQASRLVPPDFLTSAPAEARRHIPRYLRAARMRLERLRGGGLDRDARGAEQVGRAWERVTRAEGVGPLPPAARDELDAYRWMVEEFRVATFAQELRTPAPVSEKRLDEQWQRVVAAAR
jgi:ATP-dependent helicase HrpA